MSEYGRSNAYTLSYDMARAGAVIVSGMARGVDGVCHRGALDAGGFTVAVLGCGVNRIYPSEHKPLYEEIAKNGLIVSEYKPGTPPEGRNFPVRNRIISGLSDGTLVVEGSDHSGALLTARQAMLQGRDLFALPGKVGEKNSEGVNKLIADGARIITGASDIISVYAQRYPVTLRLENLPRSGVSDRRRRAFLQRSKTNSSERTADAESGKAYLAETVPASAQGYRPRKSRAIPADDNIADPAERSATPVFDENSLGQTELSVYRLIPGDRSVCADELLPSGLGMGEIITALTLLEIKRAIRFVGGNKYIRIGGANGESAGS